MAYDDSWLWKRAFIESRDDASSSEQAFFENRYLDMRFKGLQIGQPYTKRFAGDDST